MSDYKSSLHSLKWIDKNTQIALVVWEFNRNYTEALEQKTKEFLNELSVVTKGIREDWLKTAPPEAKTIIEEFQKKVGRK